MDDHSFDDLDHLAAARRARARTHIVTGVLLMVLGLAVTIVTYDSAARGGHYLVAYGPIVVGFIRIIRGLIELG